MNYIYFSFCEGLKSTETVLSVHFTCNIFNIIVKLFDMPRLFQSFVKKCQEKLGNGKKEEKFSSDIILWLIKTCSMSVSGLITIYHQYDATWNLGVGRFSWPALTGDLKIKKNEKTTLTCPYILSRSLSKD